MHDEFKELLGFCSAIGFGKIRLSAAQKKFCSELNDELISLCRTLPESMQTDALLFMMNYLKTSMNEGVDFFRYFYVPAWSIIFWLIQDSRQKKVLAPGDIKLAKTAHAMAMLLHPLDDHLIDKELPVNHLTLLLRSQAWMIMDKAFHSLAGGIDKGPGIVQGYIDDYYSSICLSGGIDSLDRYCDIFRKQMATWLITPALMLKKMGADEKYMNAVMTAYSSFGVAWRLLDDINDLQSDMIKGGHSSVCVCLADDVKRFWGTGNSDNKVQYGRHARAVLNCVSENHIIDRIKERICRELTTAASLADDIDMRSLAGEYRCLSKPLRCRRDNFEHKI